MDKLANTSSAGLALHFDVEVVHTSIGVLARCPKYPDVIGSSGICVRNAVLSLADALRDKLGAQEISVVTPEDAEDSR